MICLKVLENKEERWILLDRIATLANLNDNHLLHKILRSTLCVCFVCMCVCGSSLWCLSFWQALSLCLCSCKANLVMCNPVPLPARK